MCFFQYLQGDFLQYLKTWKELVMGDQVNVSSMSERNKMFLSSQTYEGLLTTGKFCNRVPETHKDAKCLLRPELLKA